VCLAYEESKMRPEALAFAERGLQEVSSSSRVDGFVPHTKHVNLGIARARFRTDTLPWTRGLHRHTLQVQHLLSGTRELHRHTPQDTIASYLHPVWIYDKQSYEESKMRAEALAFAERGLQEVGSSLLHLGCYVTKFA